MAGQRERRNTGAHHLGVARISACSLAMRSGARRAETLIKMDGPRRSQGRADGAEDAGGRAPGVTRGECTRRRQGPGCAENPHGAWCRCTACSARRRLNTALTSNSRRLTKGMKSRSSLSTCRRITASVTNRLRLVSDSAHVIEVLTYERVLARDELLDGIFPRRRAGCVQCDGPARVLGCMLCPGPAHPSSGSQPELAPASPSDGS